MKPKSAFILRMAGCCAIGPIATDLPSWMEDLTSGLQAHACDMSAPKILFHDNQRTIWSAGGGFNPLKGYAGFHYGLGQIDRGQFDEARSVKHAPACCLLIRKEVFEQIGLMD